MGILRAPLGLVSITVHLKKTLLPSTIFKSKNQNAQIKPMKNATKLNLIVNNMFKEEFTLEETIGLMYLTLLRKEHKKEALQISRIGIVSGFVDLNGELEVIVKFMDNIKQYTKEEFYEKTELINENHDDE